MFGKWHIGLTAYDEQGQPIRNGGVKGVERIDYSRRIDGGPLDHGFDRFFGTVCCPTTDGLYAYIDGDRVPVPPTGIIDKSDYPKNAYTRDFRPGLAAPDFDASEVEMVFSTRASSTSMSKRSRTRTSLSSCFIRCRRCTCLRSPRNSSVARWMRGRTATSSIKWTGPSAN